ncbi:MAG: DUF445 family protein [Chitinophagaceae bacterium]|nr:DUF445 family protein [Chitinophagaceae bacterium]
MMFILIPLISAFIGWITNLIAIKMLFHPRNPIRFLGLTLQGIFPKRQAQFAEKLGTLVANELIHFDEIERKITSPETIQKALPLIDQHVEHFIQNKLKEEIPLLSMFISSETMQSIKKGIVHEVEVIFPSLISQMTGHLRSELDIQKLVTEKVKDFSSDKLESILNAIMKKEFVFVEIIGGILGFLIGLLQVVLSQWL